MKIIKCQFRYEELCWILEAVDDLLYDCRLRRRPEHIPEIERIREHIIRLMKRMEADK